jgi:PKHD-type hydroxylase
MQNTRTVIDVYRTYKIFSKDECKEICKFFDNCGLEKGAVVIPSNEDPEYYRKSMVSFHKPVKETVWIFNKINKVLSKANQDFFRFDLTGYDRLQYTTYDQTSHYNWHTDTIPTQTVFGHRKLSISILLSEDFTGGDFLINLGNQDDAHNTNLALGSAIIFPSYIPHSVIPVVSGVRKSIVAWACGPQFK